MSVHLMCSNPQCQALLGFNDDQVGTIARCPECGTNLLVTRGQDFRADSPRSLRWLAIGVAVLAVVGGLGGAGWYFRAYLLDHANASGPEGPREAEIGNTFESARAIELSVAGAGTQTATLKEPGSEHVYRIVAPAAGTLVVEQDPAEGARLDGLLFAYDGDHKEVARNAPEEDKRVGQIQFPVSKDKTYYLKVGAAGQAAGAYRLSLTTVTAPGSSFATALHVRLSRTGLGTQAWNLARADEEHFFRFESPVTGPLTVRQAAAPGSGLDSHLFAFDAEQKPLDDNDDTVGFDSEVVLDAVAGKTYYLKATVHRGPADPMPKTGAYVLTISAGPGAGATFEDAHSLTLSPAGEGGHGGRINRTGSVHVYRFTAPLTTRLVVKLEVPPLSTLDPELFVYDADRRQIANNDDSGGTLNSQVEIDVTAGRAYYLKAACSSRATPEKRTGAYGLSVRPASGSGPSPGGTFQGARPLVLSPSGEATQRGRLDRLEEVHVYRFTAPLTGRLTIKLEAPSGSMLDPELFVFDADEHQIAHSDDRAERDVNSQVDVEVVSGRTYFVKAACAALARSPVKVGAYVLIFGAGPVPAPVPSSTFENARPLTVTAAGEATERGKVERVGEAHVYRFTAPGTGRLTVKLDAASGSNLDPELFAYDAERHQIASDDDGGAGLNSKVEIEVTAGRAYYLKAACSSRASPERRTGEYVLTISAVAGFTNAFQGARPLTVTAAGEANQRGKIERADEAHVYRFTAPGTGRLTIKLDAATGSNLDPELFVYDGEHHQIAANDDRPGGGLNSQVEVEVTAGKTYFARAAAARSARLEEQKTGEYVLAISAAAGFGNAFQGARPLTVTAAGEATQRGKIERAGEAHVYRFTAPGTGRLTVKLDAATGSNLDPELFAYDGQQHEIASNDDRPGGGLNSQVEFDVTSGAVYYLKAACAVRATADHKSGEYVLTISAASGFGSLFRNARPLALSPAGEATQRASIGRADEAHVYRFTAPLTGRLSVRLEAAPGSSLDPAVAVYDGDQHEIASNDDRGEGDFNSRVEVDVSTGRTYFVKAAASPSARDQQETGAYVLSLAASTR
jgi:hypothetical protein